MSDKITIRSEDLNFDYFRYYGNNEHPWRFLGKDMTVLCMFMTPEQLKRAQTKAKGKGIPFPSTKELEKAEVILVSSVAAIFLHKDFSSRPLSDNLHLFATIRHIANAFPAQGNYATNLSATWTPLLKNRIATMFEKSLAQVSTATNSVKTQLEVAERAFKEPVPLKNFISNNAVNCDKFVPFFRQYYEAQLRTLQKVPLMFVNITDISGMKLLFEYAPKFMPDTAIPHCQKLCADIAFIQGSYMNLLNSVKNHIKECRTSLGGVPYLLYATARNQVHKWAREFSDSLSRVLGSETPFMPLPITIPGIGTSASLVITTLDQYKDHRAMFNRAFTEMKVISEAQAKLTSWPIPMVNPADPTGSKLLVDSARHYSSLLCVTADYLDAMTSVINHWSEAKKVLEDLSAAFTPFKFGNQFAPPQDLSIPLPSTPSPSSTSSLPPATATDSTKRPSYFNPNKNQTSPSPAAFSSLPPPSSLPKKAPTSTSNFALYTIVSPNHDFSTSNLKSAETSEDSQTYRSNLSNTLGNIVDSIDRAILPGDTPKFSSPTSPRSQVPAPFPTQLPNPKIANAIQSNRVGGDRTKATAAPLTKSITAPSPYPLGSTNSSNISRSKTSGIPTPLPIDTSHERKVSLDVEVSASLDELLSAEDVSDGPAPIVSPISKTTATPIVGASFQISLGPAKSSQVEPRTSAFPKSKPEQPSPKSPNGQIKRAILNRNDSILEDEISAPGSERTASPEIPMNITFPRSPSPPKLSKVSSKPLTLSPAKPISMTPKISFRERVGTEVLLAEADKLVDETPPPKLPSSNFPLFEEPAPVLSPSSPPPPLDDVLPPPLPPPPFSESNLGLLPEYKSLPPDPNEPSSDASSRKVYSMKPPSPVKVNVMPPKSSDTNASPFGLSLKTKAPVSQPKDTSDSKSILDASKEVTDAPEKEGYGTVSKLSFKSKLGLFGSIAPKNNLESPYAKVTKPQDTTQMRIDRKVNSPAPSRIDLIPEEPVETDLPNESFADNSLDSNATLQPERSDESMVKSTPLPNRSSPNPIPKGVLQGPQGLKSNPSRVVAELRKSHTDPEDIELAPPEAPKLPPPPRNPNSAIANRPTGRGSPINPKPTSNNSPGVPRPSSPDTPAQKAPASKPIDTDGPVVPLSALPRQNRDPISANSESQLAQSAQPERKVSPTVSPAQSPRQSPKHPHPSSIAPPSSPIPPLPLLPQPSSKPAVESSLSPVSPRGPSPRSLHPNRVTMALPKGFLSQIDPSPEEFQRLSSPKQTPLSPRGGINANRVNPALPKASSPNRNPNDSKSPTSPRAPPISPRSLNANRVTMAFSKAPVSSPPTSSSSTNPNSQLSPRSERSTVAFTKSPVPMMPTGPKPKVNPALVSTVGTVPSDPTSQTSPLSPRKGPSSSPNPNGNRGLPQANLSRSPTTSTQSPSGIKPNAPQVSRAPLRRSITDSEIVVAGSSPQQARLPPPSPPMKGSSSSQTPKPQFSNPSSHSNLSPSPSPNTVAQNRPSSPPQNPPNPKTGFKPNLNPGSKPKFSPNRAVQSQGDPLKVPSNAPSKVLPVVASPSIALPKAPPSSMAPVSPKSHQNQSIAQDFLAKSEDASIPEKPSSEDSQREVSRDELEEDFLSNFTFGAQETRSLADFAKAKGYVTPKPPPLPEVKSRGPPLTSSSNSALQPQSLRNIGANLKAPSALQVNVSKGFPTSQPQSRLDLSQGNGSETEKDQMLDEEDE